MLVFHRKINQSVHIDGGSVVTILGVERNRVKIGITAAPDVKIVRSELLDRTEEGRDDQPNA